MNMTEKFVHDRNDHTDEHELWHLTEKYDKDEDERLNMTEIKKSKSYH